jgi:putative aldouronate transport system permease protein
MVVGKSAADKVFDALNLGFVTLVTAVLLYPLLFVLSASFSDPDMVNSGRMFLWPRGFTLESYGLVLAEAQVWRGYINTVYYVVVDIAVGFVTILPLAYALSRPERLKGAGIITFLIAFTMLFGGGLIPTYLVVKKLGMLNTVWAITVPGTVSAYMVIIIRTFFRTTIPQELYDAAEIDGASFTRIFFSVVLPLSAAIIAVLALFTGVGQWNSFFGPLIYLNDREKYPLQLVLRNLILANEAFGQTSLTELVTEPDAMEEMRRRGRLAETMKYSLIVVSSAPVLVIYPFLQKHLMKGVMLGSIKG